MGHLTNLYLVVFFPIGNCLTTLLMPMELVLVKDVSLTTQYLLTFTMHCKFNFRNLFRSPKTVMPLNHRKNYEYLIFRKNIENIKNSFDIVMVMVVTYCGNT